MFYFLFNIICHIEMMGDNERLSMCNDALLQSEAEFCLQPDPGTS